jgi:signal transduction histidine kinase
VAERFRFALSVRARTTVLATAFVAAALALGSLALVVTLDRSLVESGDGLAKARARDLAELAARDALPPVLTNIDGESVAQVVDGSGHVLAASPNVRGAGPISTLRPPKGRAVVRTVENAPDDNETENYRVWVLSARSPNGPVTVYAGTSLESVPEASRSLRHSLVVGAPATVLLIALFTWLLIGRALRPVEAIRAQVAGISDRALDRRVPVPAAEDEVGRLAVTMNGMLERLETAQRQQHEFVADASHELQSPIAAIRAQLEVALAHPEGADWAEIATDILTDCDQTERLVRDLLFLARQQEAGATMKTAEPLDLDDIVLQEAARARASSRVPLDTSRVSGAPVCGHRDELRRLVRNLIENAVRHADGAVRLSVSSDDGCSRLDVEDDGPGVPAEERSRVFDRFYRTDVSRSRDTGGTGLGLAIARAVAESHGGSLRLDDTGTGAHFVLLLPTDHG